MILAMQDGPDAGISALASSALYYPNGPDGDLASASSSINGNVSVNLVAYYKWFPYYDDGTDYPTPTTPTPPPPASTNFLLQTSLIAYYSNGYQAVSAAPSGMSSAASAGDQYGDQVQIASPDGPYPYSFGSYGVYDTRNAGGRRLLTVPVSVVNGQGIYAVHLSGTTHAEAYDTLDANRYRGGGAVAAAFINGRVRHDDRAVAISSPNIEAPISYRKSSVDSSHLDGRWPNVRDPFTGQISVDTAVTRAAGEYVASASPSGDRFIGQASNFTHPYYTWAFQGPDGKVGLYSQQYLGVESDQFQVLLLNLYFGSSLDGFPKFSQLQLTVRDGLDNATAATTYGVHWHLPYEETAFLGSVPKKVKLEKLYGPIGQGDFSDVQISAARDIKIDEGFELAGGIAAAVGQEEGAAVLEIIGKLAKLTDAKYHYAGENVQYGTQNGQDKWDATLLNPDWAANVDNPKLLKHFNDTTKKFDGWGFFSLEIYEVKHYHHMTWSADKYNSHGYDSSGYTLYADPVDKIDEEPYYTQNLFPNP